MKAALVTRDKKNTVVVYIFKNAAVLWTYIHRCQPSKSFSLTLKVLLILLCFILFKIYGRVQKTYEQIEEKLVSQRRRRDYKTSELEDEVSLLDEEETLRNRYYIDIRFEELGLCSKKG